MDKTAEEIQQLQEENDRLKEQVETQDADLRRLKSERRIAWQATKGLGRLSGRLALGGTLTAAIENWIRASSPKTPVPANETAEVLAAMFRRVVGISVLGFLVASLPILLLLWQNWEIREQNNLFGEGMRQQSAQHRELVAVQQSQVKQTRSQHEGQLREVQSQHAETLRLQSEQIREMREQHSITTQQQEDQLRELRRQHEENVSQQAAQIDLLQEQHASSLAQRQAEITHLQQQHAESIEEQQRQLAQQVVEFDTLTRDSKMTRRSQLIDIIYKCKPDSRPTREQPVCKPAAHPRAREEAVNALLEIQRETSTELDLSWADLSGLDLRSVSLKGVKLHGSNLQESWLGNLEGADIGHANLEGALVGFDDLKLARPNSKTIFPSGSSRPPESPDLALEEQIAKNKHREKPIGF